MSCLGNSIIGALEESLVKRVIRRKDLFRYGSDCRESFCLSFENWVNRLIPRSHSLLVPSASVGLDLLLEILCPRPKPRVLTLPIGWVAIYSAVIRYGGSLYFALLDDLFTVNIANLEEILEDQKIDVIIIPHLLGRAISNIDEITAVAERYKVSLIEDIAQSFGVKHPKGYVGSFGRAAYTSFNHHKTISCGDGGLVLFKNYAEFENCWMLHDQGCLFSGSKRKVSESNFIPGNSLRMNELSGAILTGQSCRLAYIKAKVAAIRSEFDKRLSELGVKIVEASSGEIAFTSIFENNHKFELPTLEESGWHVYWNIPYKNLSLNSEARAKTREILRRYSMLGCGFVDKYYSTPFGLELSCESDKINECVEMIISKITL